MTSQRKTYSDSWSISRSSPALETMSLGLGGALFTQLKQV
jgi:hypothetical protein